MSDNSGPKETNRLSVSLSHRGLDSLTKATTLTKDSKTEVVNRALTTYALVVESMANGDEILIRDKKGQMKLLHLA